ncbi:hypothetical protein LTR27_009111 [Elasticomyces elasticus]|nr:hypothetical protein LTR27_009111 [Elasticomyces elasticus]
MESWDDFRHALAELDPESAELILQLRLEDMTVPPPEPVECSVCNNQHQPENTLKAPCDHYYCRGCIEHLYNACLTDESLYPPRCCRQAMPWDLVSDFLSQETRDAFRAKRVEWDTQDRTYCHVRDCSKFIKPDDYIGDIAPCSNPDCLLNTCIKCKAAHHGGACKEDEDTKIFKAKAKEEGYQQCCGCGRMVELNTGCNHMTCPCSEQFCYVCGAKWKTCECPQWNEERLTERAQAHVDNAGIQARNALERAAQLNRAAQELRDNHECEHNQRWTRMTTGSLRCEECMYIQHRFVDECNRCHLRACYRCRTNRL